jgi:hypothetical protein
MEPQDDAIDLSELDPKRAGARFDAAVARVAARGRELMQLRRALVRRGVVGVVLVAAAGLALWLSAPRRPERAQGNELLGWALRDPQPAEILGVGGSYAR